MPLILRSPLSRRVRRLIAALTVTGLIHSAGAQTLVTLDGTSGTNSIPSNYSTSEGLDVSLGFFTDYLVVGGGGGNGSGKVNVAYPSGGGGGGVRGGAGRQIWANLYPLTVGAGGAGGGNGDGVSGSSSTVFGVTVGGGLAPLLVNPGVGGASAAGYPGGNRASGPPAGAQGGGGGGDTGAGGNGIYLTSPVTRIGGTGGPGTLSEITGVSLSYGFGGGGGAPGGNFQNGDGSKNVGPRANSGGGGAGASTGAGPGASGTVIIRYQGARAGNGGVVSTGTGTASGWTIHSFNTAGAGGLDFSALDMDSRLGAMVTGEISGAGPLRFLGPGRLILAGTNTYAGATTISAGTVQVGAGGVSGTLGSGPVTNNARLAFNRSDVLVVTNGITGSGILMQNGSGATVLTAANASTGDSYINAGTLALADNGTLLSGRITVAGGAKLDVFGIDSLALGTSQTLSNTSGTALLAGRINASVGRISLSYAGSEPAFAVSGLLTLSSDTGFHIHNTGPALEQGSYKLISGGTTGGVEGDLPRFTVGGGGLAANSSATLSIIGGELYLNVSQDITAPTVVSIKRKNPQSQLARTNSVVFEVAFSEPVQNVRAESFQVTAVDSSIAGTVTGVSGGPQVYDVTVAINSGAGEFRLIVPASNSGTSF